LTVSAVVVEVFVCPKTGMAIVSKANIATMYGAVIEDFR
jgi:hypothetical protein